VGERGNAYRILVRKSLGKLTLGLARNRCGNGIQKVGGAGN
jgi:hypothetical protein